MRAVLLANLGSPAAPTVAAVRAYLDEFLMDPDVIDLPWPLRRILVSAFILPTRPKASAEAYRAIWTEAGSPLLVGTRALRDAVSQRLGDVPVAFGMRYGEPSLEDALDRLAAHADVDGVLLVPLYPQYAASTSGTSERRVKQLARARGLALDVLPPFHADEGYLDALAASIRPHVAGLAPAPGEGVGGDAPQHLLFSYHGLPERHLRRADPTGSHCLVGPDCCEVASPAHATCYRQQCRATTHAIVARMGLPPECWSISFQSRLGRAKWLEPYTDRRLAELPGEGVRRLVVATPAFVADNLETLEEIAIRGRQTFVAAGGESLDVVPCLNDDPAWVDALAALIRRRVA